MVEETYTAEQVKEYAEEFARQQMSEKANVHSFFTKVILHDDTTRIGNVKEEELGEPQLTLRGVKELELFCKEIEGNELWSDYFKNLAEIQTSTSLSKEGFLLRLPVTSKQELSDGRKVVKQNKGWFKKRRKE